MHVLIQAYTRAYTNAMCGGEGSAVCLLLSSAFDVQGRHRCEQLLWECGWGGEAPEVVLGADLLYDPGVIPALVALLHGLLRAGAQAYIATTLRNATTVEAFVEAACGAGLAVEDATQELQRRRDIGFQACDVLENRAAVRVHRLWLRE